MDKIKALQFAKTVIEDLKDAFTYDFKEDEPLHIVINQSDIDNDPNLEILNSELNKINFKIQKDTNNLWLISKIK